MSSKALEQSKAYHEVKKKICQRLLEDWRSSDRLPPIKELARELGAGKPSTHQAIKELVREGLLVSRPKLGTFVSHDFPGKKNKLDLLLSDDAPPPPPLAGKKIQLLFYHNIFEERSFFIRAIDSFTAAMSEAGCKVTTTLINNLKTLDIEPLLNKQAHAIAVFNPCILLQIECLPSQILTVVSPSSECTVAMGERFDLITADDIQGSLLAGKYFREKGWKDVCFLGARYGEHPLRYDKISLKRLEGLTTGLGETIRPEWQLWCGGHVNCEAATIVRDWLKLDPRPSAIFAASDDLAYGFIYGAVAHGLFPGKDFQIIGFDAQKECQFYDSLVLTSVAIPVVEMGMAAAKMLIKRLENPDAMPQRMYLGCKLNEGNTVIQNI
jgi:DNA-binding LacI/PurR family transcriptional regulator